MPDDLPPDIPDDVLGAYGRGDPRDEDEEVRQLADLERPIEAAQGAVRRELATAPMDRITTFERKPQLDANGTPISGAWDVSGRYPPSLDEHDRLIDERDRLRARILRRMPMSLREPTANELAAVEAACAEWVRKSPDQRTVRLNELIDAVAGGPRERYLETRGDLGYLMERAGVDGDVERFRVLLCLSRGFDPGDGSVDAALTVSSDPRSRHPGRLVLRVRPIGHLFSHEELLSAKARRVQEIEDLHFKVYFGRVLGFRPAVAGQEHLHPQYGEVPQLLLDETALYLDLGRLHQALDGQALLPAPEPWLKNARIPSPLRQEARVNQTLATLCGERFSLDRAIDAEGAAWANLSTMQRAWTINKLVLDMLEAAPEHADRVRPSDLTDAANRDTAAWESLRAACKQYAKDESAPSPRIPTRPKDRRRWRATWLKVKPERARNKSYSEMAEWVSKDKNLKVSPDVLADIIRAGEAGLLDEPSNGHR